MSGTDGCIPQTGIVWRPGTRIMRMLRESFVVKAGIHNFLFSNFSFKWTRPWGFCSLYNSKSILISYLGGGQIILQSQNCSPVIKPISESDYLFLTSGGVTGLSGITGHWRSLVTAPPTQTGLSPTPGFATLVITTHEKSWGHTDRYIIWHPLHLHNLTRPPQSIALFTSPRTHTFSTSLTILTRGSFNHS